MQTQNAQLIIEPHAALPQISRPELSQIVRLDDITSTANTIVIEANVRECIALAVRFELAYLRNLSAELTFRRTRSGQMVRIDGRITATYGQICGLTLAAMPMVMEESFQSEYTLSAWEKYSEFDLDQPEILTDDFIDMGEVTAQYFGLAIDPYARRAGAEILPELTQYLSAAVQELLAGTPPPQPEGEAVVNTRERKLETLSAAADVVPATAETIEPPLLQPIFIKSITDLPVSDIDLIPDEPQPTGPEFEPDFNPQPPHEQPYESLFMKYLRQLRAA